METSKIDVLALASLRLAMVTVHVCCGGSRLSQPEISQIQAEKLRCVQEGFWFCSKAEAVTGFLPLLPSRSAGGQEMRLVGRVGRSGHFLSFTASKDELFCF